MRFSELDGAAVGVWGAGRELASFAAQLALRVPSARIVAAAFDSPPASDVRETLRAPSARIVTGAEIVPALSQCDVVVRSPGVTVHRAEMRALRERGVPVTTATSLWLAERGGAGVIGITGTKGKSTTAALAAHLARAAGKKVALAGNIGVPALDLLDHERAQVTVVELSSYQIADLEVGPEVAVVTNLFREHTQWHGSEGAYHADKLRLLRLPGVRAAVINARDERLTDMHMDARTIGYGVAAGWDATAEGVTLRGEPVAGLGELALRGEHNALNLCGALAALEALGVAPPPLPASLDGFQPLAHRLQPVAEHKGVLWVDDSISTTPESALAALASFPGREIILIAGGQDRGQDYTELGHALVAAGATVIGVPSTGPRLLAAVANASGVPAARVTGANAPAGNAAAGQLRTIEAADMREAVDHARALARHGTVVLLSPAAPSFDHYRDFEERGERFRALATSS